MKHLLFYLLIFTSIPTFAKGIEQTDLDILQKSIENKTVYIECFKEKQWHKSQGFIITHDGYILTAKHVIEEASQIFGSWIDSKGEEHVKKIELVSKHPRYDLALLKVSLPENREFSYFQFDMNPVQIHQWIFLGYYHVADKRFTLRGGKIMYIEFSSTFQSIPQAYTSFSTSAEDDGGPCFQSEGKIVGVFIGNQTIHVEFSKFLPYLEFKDWLDEQLSINRPSSKSEKNIGKKDDSF